MSTPGGTWTDRELPTGRPLRLRRGVGAGGDDDPGPPQDPAQQQVRGGQATGDRDLGPVKDHAVGPSQVRAEEADRERRVEHHEVGAGLLGQGVDPAGEEGMGSSTGSRLRTTRKGCSASNSAAPS